MTYELKLTVLQIKTPFYTLLIRDIDGSVCGLRWLNAKGVYTQIAFGVIAELDLDGETRYCPHHIRIPKDFTDALSSIKTTEASEIEEWVEKYIPSLTNEPCRDDRYLIFSLDVSGFGEYLKKAESVGCLHPFLKGVTDSNYEFLPSWVDRCLLEGIELGFDFESDYQHIWLSGATKALSGDGHFVTTPEEEVLADEWDE